MERFKFISRQKLSNLPENTGVYTFKNESGLLYVGKAINIKNRVKNHFNQPSFRDRLFLDKIKSIGYIKTDSEIEALILEAALIKKFRPKFNVIWKDSKDYFYIVITLGEERPRVFITHQPKNFQFPISNFKFLYIGPFTEGKALKQTLKILRKIFPFYSVKKHPKNLCPYCHLGLCPGPNPDLKEYKSNIKNLIAFFEGKKKSVLSNLKKEMFELSKKKNFEKAARIRDKISALENILSHTKIFTSQTDLQTSLKVYEKTERELKKLLKMKKDISRIEGYDVSNIQGKEATGSMVVFIKGRPDKNSYRKFKIKTIEKPNDIAMLKEVLERRFNHPEWQYPDVILIDGGKAQLNVAINSKSQILNSKQIPNPKSQIPNIKILAIAKRNNDLYIERKEQPIPLETLPRGIFNLILQIRDESHRFAHSYHKKLREKELVRGQTSNQY